MQKRIRELQRELAMMTYLITRARELADKGQHDTAWSMLAAAQDSAFHRFGWEEMVRWLDRATDPVAPHPLAILGQGTSRTTIPAE